jgi:hypothetical protein
VKLGNQRKSEIEQLVNRKDKLSHHRIASECYDIFQSNLPTLISTLVRNSFITAADFTRVSGDGCLMNNVGAWIKIAGLGSERSSKLLYWRVTIEEKENAKIQREVTSKFAKIEHELITQWNLTESIHKKNLEPLEVRFRNKELEISKNKSRLNQEKEGEKKKINQKYDKLRNDLKWEFIVALNRFYSEVELVYSETKTSLNFNLSYYETKLKGKVLEVRQFGEWIEGKEKEHSQLFLQVKFPSRLSN